MTNAKSDLDLSGNTLGDAGLIVICRSLSKNSCLQSLSLAYNDIQDLPKAGACPLEIAKASLSTVNTTLAKLDLRGNFIKESGARLVLETMKERKSVSKNTISILVAERVSFGIFEQIWSMSSPGKKKGGKKGKKGKKKK